MDPFRLMSYSFKIFIARQEGLIYPLLGIAFNRNCLTEVMGEIVGVYKAGKVCVYAGDTEY